MEGNIWSIQVDLNDPVNMDDEGFSIMNQQINDMERGQHEREEVQDVELGGRGSNETQDSDPFQLGPIIAAISRESRRRKRRIEEVEDEVDGTDREVNSNGNKRALIFTEAEETSHEGSPRSL